MKSLKEVLDNYSDYETFLDDRFGKRMLDFVTTDNWHKLNIRLSGEASQEDIDERNNSVKEWNEANIKDQLKNDLQFAYYKAQGERGISSELMVNVVASWMKVLEDKEFSSIPHYSDYGKSYLRAVANKYEIDYNDYKED